MIIFLLQSHENLSFHYANKTNRGSKLHIKNLVTLPRSLNRTEICQQSTAVCLEYTSGIVNIHEV